MIVNHRQAVTGNNLLFQLVSAHTSAREQCAGLVQSKVIDHEALPQLEAKNNPLYTYFFSLLLPFVRGSVSFLPTLPLPSSPI